MNKSLGAVVIGGDDQGLDVVRGLGRRRTYRVPR
jgi:hypothetical protein